MTACLRIVIAGIGLAAVACGQGGETIESTYTPPPLRVVSATPIPAATATPIPLQDQLREEVMASELRICNRACDQADCHVEGFHMNWKRESEIGIVITIRCDRERITTTAALRQEFGRWRIQ